MGDYSELKKKLQQHQQQNQDELQNLSTNLRDIAAKKLLLWDEHMEAHAQTVSRLGGEIDSSLQSVQSQIDSLAGTLHHRLGTQLEEEMTAWVAALHQHREKLQTQQHLLQQELLKEMATANERLISMMQDRVTVSIHELTAQMQEHQDAYQRAQTHWRSRYDQESEGLTKVQVRREVLVDRNKRMMIGSAIWIGVMLILTIGSWQWAAKTREAASAQYIRVEQELVEKYQTTLEFLDQHEWAPLAVGTKNRGKWWVRVQPESCAVNPGTNEWWGEISPR